MIMDKLGKLFEERRKKNQKVEVDRRKEDINKVNTNTEKENEE